jgi:hypothetical protein
LKGYYMIFYELWTFADFDRLCKLCINKQISFKNLLVKNHLANFNQALSEWSLGGLKNHVIYVKKLIIVLINTVQIWAHSGLK